MKNRFTAIFIAALVLLTALAAAWHLSTRPLTEEGALIVHYKDAQTVLHADTLALTDVKGEVVNGKGDTIIIDAQGISLPALLAAAGAESAQSVTAAASDEYTARLTAGEFDRAYIIIPEENSFQLIVFGDPDSRRNVRNLAEVIAE